MQDLKQRLDRAVETINRPEFIPNDPVQFPRRFSDLRDIEIVSFLAAIIAWGKRPMILRDCERLLQTMEQQPYRYVMEGAWEELPDRQNIHRTMFGEHLKYMLRGFREVYRHYGSLDEFAAAMRVGESDAPSWEFAAALQSVLLDVNAGKYCTECLPSQLDKTALKRFNMALRWLVRDDGIVDLGVWKSIPESKLYIPLDIHVARVSRSLGLIERKSNDRKAVEQLTDALRRFDSADPCRYDFALFGVGVAGTDL